jgi:hypothetical protein
MKREKREQGNEVSGGVENKVHVYLCVLYCDGLPIILHPSPSFSVLLHPSVLPSILPSFFRPSIGASVQPWFDTQRGFATGLAMAGSGVGNLAMPFMWDAAVASQGLYNQIQCGEICTLKHDKFDTET